MKTYPRTCKYCGKLLCAPTLNEMTPEELLHYGKVQAARFITAGK